MADVADADRQSLIAAIVCCQERAIRHRWLSGRHALAGHLKGLVGSHRRIERIKAKRDALFLSPDMDAKIFSNLKATHP